MMMNHFIKILQDVFKNALRVILIVKLENFYYIINTENVFIDLINVFPSIILKLLFF